MERFLIPVLKASFHDWLLVWPRGSLDHLCEAWGGRGLFIVSLSGTHPSDLRGLAGSCLWLVPSLSEAPKQHQAFSIQVSGDF